MNVFYNDLRTIAKKHNFEFICSETNWIKIIEPDSGYPIAFEIHREPHYINTDIKIKELSIYIDNWYDHNDRTAFIGDIKQIRRNMEPFIEYLKSYGLPLVFTADLNERKIQYESIAIDDPSLI